MVMVHQLVEDSENSTPARAKTLEDWYVLKTKPHAEELVFITLSRHKIDCYLPKLLVSKKGQKELKSIPLFPGYIFFQLELDSNLWPFMRWASGVSYVISDDLEPISIPNSIIHQIERGEAAQHERMRQPYKANEHLQIVSGPLAGLEAIFSGVLSGTRRVQVLVQILGQLTRVNIEAEALARLT